MRHPCARHADLDRPKAAEELTLSGSVPVAFGLAQRPLVAATAQGRRQFLFQQLLNEATNAFADAELDRIKPPLAGKQPSVNRVRRRAILFHGVVSAGVPTPVVVG